MEDTFLFGFALTVVLIGFAIDNNWKLRTGFFLQVLDQGVDQA